MHLKQYVTSNVNRSAFEVFAVMGSTQRWVCSELPTFRNSLLSHFKSQAVLKNVYWIDVIMFFLMYPKLNTTGYSTLLPALREQNFEFYYRTFVSTILTINNDNS